MSGREMLEICTTSVQNPRPRHARFCIARAPSACSFRERARREVISRGPTDKKRGLGGRLAGCARDVLLMSEAISMHARDVLLLSREPSHVGAHVGACRWLRIYRMDALRAGIAGTRNGDTGVAV